MIILLTDSTYNVIISYLEVNNSQSLSGTNMSIDFPSFIDGKISKTLYVSEDKVPNEIRDDLKNNFLDYIYTEENGFKKRPKITVSSANDKQLMKISQDGAHMFPLGEEIELMIRYEDPDSIGFIHKFDKIAVHDRNEFVSVKPFIDVVKDITEYKLKVKSNFPGVAMVRAKDTNYLCGCNTLLIRFMQQ